MSAFGAATIKWPLGWFVDFSGDDGELCCRGLSVGLGPLVDETGWRSPEPLLVSVLTKNPAHPFATPKNTRFKKTQVRQVPVPLLTVAKFFQVDLPLCALVAVFDHGLDLHLPTRTGSAQPPRLATSAIEGVVDGGCEEGSRLSCGDDVCGWAGRGVGLVTSVGLLPSERITVPSSSASTYPSPSLSKNLNISWIGKQIGTFDPFDGKVNDGRTTWPTRQRCAGTVDADGGTTAPAREIGPNKANSSRSQTQPVNMRRCTSEQKTGNPTFILCLTSKLSLPRVRSPPRSSAGPASAIFRRRGRAREGGKPGPTFDCFTNSVRLATAELR